MVSRELYCNVKYCIEDFQKSEFLLVKLSFDSNVFMSRQKFVLYRNLLNYYTLFIIAEVLDYGYPQKTDTGILKTYITQTGIRTQVRSVFFCYYL